MDETAAAAPESVAGFMWVLEHVGVPAVIGLVIGLYFRSLFKSVAVLGVLWIAGTFVMAKMGGGSGTEQVSEQTGSIMPTLTEVTGSVWRMLRSSPAAVVGLGIGIFSRERWRSRKGSGGD